MCISTPLSPFGHKKYFLIESECKPPIECLTFISHFPAFGLNKERYFVLLKTLCYLKWLSPQLLTWIYISFFFKVT